MGKEMKQMQPAKEKLHTLYKIYEKPMYHIAYAILHHTQQTEDAVSEAFCRVIANLHKIAFQSFVSGFPPPIASRSLMAST